MTDEIKIETETPKVKQVKSYEGFRVYEIKDDGTPVEILKGTREEIDKLGELQADNNWDKTYAIRIGKFGLK